MISIFQALILGLLQGVTELFPISSLGHSVLIAYVLNWTSVLNGTTNKASSFLLFLVVLHLATATALLFFYRKTWIRIIKAFIFSLLKKSHNKKDAKLMWLLILATIPAAAVGLVFQSILQEQFAKPLGAIIFIFINGLILYYADKRINSKRKRTDHAQDLSREDVISDRLTAKRSFIIGVSQIFALLAGISRSGITMVGGILSGLNRDEAAEFSFLLATPIIFGAGLYKLPSVFSSKSNGLHTQMLIGALASGIAAYLAVRFLDKYFKKNSYKPFAFYCMGVGVLVLLVGFIRGNL